MSCGCSDACGLVFNGTPAAFPGVLEIIDAANIVAGWDAADLSASPVALWPDASGNGFDLTQAVGGSQPTWTAAGGPNGNPTVLFDGVADFLTNVALTRPAPGVQVTTFWAVLRQVTWTNVDCFWDNIGGGAMQLLQLTLTPSIETFNGANANQNTNLLVNAFARLLAHFSNSVADELQAGGVTATGANAGNSALAGFTLGANGIPAGFANVEICELWIFNILPSAAQRAELDAYVRNRYGTGLV